MNNLSQLSQNKKLMFHLIGFLVGVLLGAFILFQILFLSSVIPHGGI